MLSCPLTLLTYNEEDLHSSQIQNGIKVMLMLISPAKTLDFESPVRFAKFTQPDFIKDSKNLIKTLRRLSKDDIEDLMHVSKKIAALNHSRFRIWNLPFTEENARQAIFAFKGDVYTGIEIEAYSKTDLNYAQKHLRILSGLYGVLRPLDLMQPYRLEMGRSLENDRGKNLYEFWGSKATAAINAELVAQQDDVLINLASSEYFKVLNQKQLNAEVLTPIFKDYKNGKYKVISFFAKKARGLMTSYIIQNRIETPKGLKAFTAGGYAYNTELSSNKELVFTRKLP